MLSNETTFTSESSKSRENVQLPKLKNVYVSAYEWFEYAYYCAEKGGPSAWSKFKKIDDDIIQKKLGPTKINEKKLKKIYDDDLKQLNYYFDKYKGGNIKEIYDCINKILTESYRCDCKELSGNLTIKKLYEAASKALKQLYNLKLEELKNSNKAIVSFKKCLEEYTWIKYVSRSIEAKVGANANNVNDVMKKVESFLQNCYINYIDYYSIYYKFKNKKYLLTDKYFCKVKKGIVDGFNKLVKNDEKSIAEIFPEFKIRKSYIQTQKLVAFTRFLGGNKTSAIRELPSNAADYDKDTELEKFIEKQGIDSKIKDIIVLNSHDAGTYTMLVKSIFDIFNKIARTQIVRIKLQLESGARSFDFRVKYYKGVLVFFHGNVLGGPAEEAFDDIYEFLITHKSEIVFVGCGYEKIKDLKSVKDMLRLNMIYNPEKNTDDWKNWHTKTIGYILNYNVPKNEQRNGGKLIIFGDGKNTVPSNNNYVYQKKSRTSGSDEILALGEAYSLMRQRHLADMYEAVEDIRTCGKYNDEEKVVYAEQMLAKLLSHPDYKKWNDQHPNNKLTAKLDKKEKQEFLGWANKGELGVHEKLNDISIPHTPNAIEVLTEVIFGKSSHGKPLRSAKKYTGKTLEKIEKLVGKNIKIGRAHV